MGTVAESVRDVVELARRLTPAVNRGSTEAMSAMLIELQESAWDEYQLLLSLSDRIDGAGPDELAARAVGIQLTAEQCARAIDEYHDHA